VPLVGEERRVFRGDGGGRARQVAEEGDLAEALARPGVRDLLAVDVDLDSAVLDDVVPVARVALSEDRVTGGDPYRLQLRREMLERRWRKRREDRIRAEDLDVLGRNLDALVDEGQLPPEQQREHRKSGADDDERSSRPDHVQ